ncbi:MAG: response regulator [Kiloniellales bacterium]|nr:response regulator [Kiloniellales bacterium]
MGKPRIFIIDDDEAVRDSLRALLESTHMSVETYASGREFLESYRNRAPGCVVLDMDLPHMSGLEVVEVLAARDDSIPVIVMTGRSEKALQRRYRRGGVTALLEKPTSEGALLEAIDQALSRYRSGSAGTA